MKYKGDDGANYLIAQGYSAVGIATRLRTAKTMYPVSIPSRGKNFSSFLESISSVVLPILLYSGYRWIFRRRLRGGSVKLTIHLHIMRSWSHYVACCFDSKQRQGIFIFFKESVSSVVLPILLYSGYRWIFRRRLRDGSVKLTIHLHIMRSWSLYVACGPGQWLSSTVLCRFNDNLYSVACNTGVSS